MAVIGFTCFYESQVSIVSGDASSVVMDKSVFLLHQSTLCNQQPLYPCSNALSLNIGLIGEILMNNRNVYLIIKEIILG